MAIEKRLIHFNEDTEFKKRLNNNEILDTSIVFVKDLNKIYTHDTEYKFVGWSVLQEDVPEGYNLFYTTDGALETQEGYVYVKEE